MVLFDRQKLTIVVKIGSWIGDETVLVWHLDGRERAGIHGGVGLDDVGAVQDVSGDRIDIVEAVDLVDRDRDRLDVTRFVGAAAGNDGRVAIPQSRGKRK